MSGITINSLFSGCTGSKVAPDQDESKEPSSQQLQIDLTNFYNNCVNGDLESIQGVLAFRFEALGAVLLPALYESARYGHVAVVKAILDSCTRNNHSLAIDLSREIIFTPLASAEARTAIMTSLIAFCRAERGVVDSDRQSGGTGSVASSVTADEDESMTDE